MEKQNTSNKIRDELYNYKYLLDKYDYSVFVETIVSEINKILEDEDQ